jgi:hypothetical protein
MIEYKIFTFHSQPDRWRVEVYDINNRLVEVYKAKDREDARAVAESYLAPRNTSQFSDT